MSRPEFDPDAVDDGVPSEGCNLTNCDYCAHTIQSRTEVM